MRATSGRRQKETERILSFIRKQLSVTNVMVVAALIFAMAGGAFAATGSGADSASHRGHAANKHKGKGTSSGERGPRGKQGPAGPAGPAGEKGATGAPGATGKEGPAGNAGADGQSVTALALKAGEEGCKEGGVKLTSASGSSTVCNGTKGSAGPEGPEGALGTAGTTLPPEASETGTWSYDFAGAPPTEEQIKNEEGGPKPGSIVVSIGFAIPLAAPLTAAEVHIVWGNETAPAGCTGGSISTPKAEPGNLCIYAVSEKSANGLEGEPQPFNFEEGGVGAGRTGTNVIAFAKPEALVYGNWVLRAPK
jgi:hypothetical protein